MVDMSKNLGVYIILVPKLTCAYCFSLFIYFYVQKNVMWQDEETPRAFSSKIARFAPSSTIAQILLI